MGGVLVTAGVVGVVGAVLGGVVVGGGVVVFAWPQAATVSDSAIRPLIRNQRTLFFIFPS